MKRDERRQNWRKIADEYRRLNKKMTGKEATAKIRDKHFPKAKLGPLRVTIHRWRVEFGQKCGPRGVRAR